MNTTGDTTMQDDSDEQQEVIEVQILPQVSLLKRERPFYICHRTVTPLDQICRLVVIDQHQYIPTNLLCIIVTTVTTTSFISVT